MTKGELIDAVAKSAKISKARRRCGRRCDVRQHRQGDSQEQTLSGTGFRHVHGAITQSP